MKMMISRSRPIWFTLAMVAVLTLIGLVLMTSTVAATGSKSKLKIRETGVAFSAEAGECTDDIPAQLNGNDFVPELTLKFTGGLEGCIYTYPDITTSSCTERFDGTYAYFEEGKELFIGTYTDEDGTKEDVGTLKTKYFFRATFPTLDDCQNFTNQIDGGCIHEFVRNRRTGIFRKARGQFAVIDNIEDGVPVSFPYLLELDIRQ